MLFRTAVRSLTAGQYNLLGSRIAKKLQIVLRLVVFVIFELIRTKSIHEKDITSVFKFGV